MRTNREKAAIIWREKEQILMVFLGFSSHSATTPSTALYMEL